MKLHEDFNKRKKKKGFTVNFATVGVGLGIFEACEGTVLQIHVCFHERSQEINKSKIFSLLRKKEIPIMKLPTNDLN